VNVMVIDVGGTNVKILAKATALKENHLRFRVSPDVAIAMGMTVMAPGGDMTGMHPGWRKQRE
jgi:hypothetical protein